MTEHDRLIKLARACYARFNSYAGLGEFLGVSRQQAHRICGGKSEPTGSQVVRMQDLLKKAAMVLMAWGVASAPQIAEAALNKTSVAHQGVALEQQGDISRAKLAEYTLSAH